MGLFVHKSRFVLCPSYGLHWLDHNCVPVHDEFNGASIVSHLNRPAMTTVRDLLRLAASLCMALLCTAGGARAADVSRWDGDARSAVRLVAGSSASAAWRAGVEIRLKPGWHTYWRYPGDAGVPPRFDFGGSQNLKQARVLWPAPQRIVEAGGSSIGYLGDVIFPLVIEAADPGKPVLLRLKLDYAVCEKLCVPAEASVELALAKESLRAQASRDTALTAAQGRVPRKVALGEGSTLAIRSVRREPGRPRVLVDVAGAVDLFAEGPTAHWALPLPAKIDGAPAGLQRFAFELDGLPPGASAQGALITLTATTPEDAIEVTTRLD
jgi:DsbC/DsbD-like thiol-disulfide interchange protein